MIPNIRHHWSTPIAKYKNVKLAEKLKDYILTLNAEGIESGVAPVIKHNLVESKFNFYKTDEPVIHDTVKWLSECISVTVKALNPDHKVNYKINFIDSWYHISKKYSVHGAHVHPMCSWAGVFYIDPGDNKDGYTHYYSPVRSTYVDAGNTALASTGLDIKPMPGNLILFPAYLQHAQQIYTGDVDRIVTAFNAQVTIDEDT